MTVIQGPLSVAEFRKNLGDAIGTVRFSKPGTSIEIQNRGVTVAVLVSATTATLLEEIVRLARDDKFDEIGSLVAANIKK